MPSWFIAFWSLGSAGAQAQWWDAQWSDRATLTFDNAAQAEDLVDFPVLVVLDDAVNFDHTAVQSAGEDLRFIDADGVTELAFEIERWNTGGVSHIWVRVPQIDGNSSADKIWMYFGNPSATSTEDASGTWRSSYVAVFHLTGGEEDSSSPAHHGTNQGSADADGYIARAKEFDGNNDQIVIADESAFDFTTAMTASLWFRAYGFTHDWEAFLAKGDGSWRISRFGASNNLAWATDWNTGNNTNRNTSGSVNINDGNWHYAHAIYDQAAGEMSL